MDGRYILLAGTDCAFFAADAAALFLAFAACFYDFLHPVHGDSFCSV